MKHLLFITLFMLACQNTDRPPRFGHEVEITDPFVLKNIRDYKKVNAVNSRKAILAIALTDVSERERYLYIDQYVSDSLHVSTIPTTYSIVDSTLVFISTAFDNCIEKKVIKNEIDKIMKAYQIHLHTNPDLIIDPPFWKVSLINGKTVVTNLR